MLSHKGNIPRRVSHRAFTTWPCAPRNRCNEPCAVTGFDFRGAAGISKYPVLTPSSQCVSYASKRLPVPPRLEVARFGTRPWHCRDIGEPAGLVAGRLPLDGSEAEKGGEASMVIGGAESWPGAPTGYLGLPRFVWGVQRSVGMHGQRLDTIMDDVQGVEGLQFSVSPPPRQRPAGIAGRGRRWGLRGAHTRVMRHVEMPACLSGNLASWRAKPSRELAETPPGPFGGPAPRPPLPLSMSMPSAFCTFLPYYCGNS